MIGCEDRLRNDLYCVGWGVKLYSNQTKCTGLGANFSTCNGLGWVRSHKMDPWTTLLPPVPGSASDAWSSVVGLSAAVGGRRSSQSRCSRGSAEQVLATWPEPRCCCHQQLQLARQPLDQLTTHTQRQTVVKAPWDARQRRSCTSKKVKVVHTRLPSLEFCG